MRRWGILLAGAIGLAGCGDDTPSGQAAMQEWVGKNASALVVESLDGGKRALKDVAAGRPVVLNVWATWCAPCLREMPTLDALGKQGRYAVVAVATDQDAQVVKDYLARQGLGRGMTVLFDGLGIVTRKALGARGLPITYVMDKDLTVRLVEVGERDWAHPRMREKMAEAVGR